MAGQAPCVGVLSRQDCADERGPHWTVQPPWALTARRPQRVHGHAVGHQQTAAPGWDPDLRPPSPSRRDWDGCELHEPGHLGGHGRRLCPQHAPSRRGHPHAPLPPPPPRARPPYGPPPHGSPPHGAPPRRPHGRPSAYGAGIRGPCWPTSAPAVAVVDPDLPQLWRQRSSRNLLSQGLQLPERSVSEPLRALGVLQLVLHLPATAPMGMLLVNRIAA
mmetsp:Transcript_14543/g.31546  ORF Transcript_14543/g.31546 Transcript_14543/m.31546 type:complete len:218 (+) Transcript_14543:2532-3185(+)